MAQSRARTRHLSSSPLVEYLGPGKEFLPSELPTLRAVLQFGIHLQDIKIREEEVKKNTYLKSELVKDMSLGVLVQWKKANHLFEPPVICTQKSLERRLEKEWDRALLVRQGRAKKSQKAELESKLDKLLDILTCHCQPTQPCSDVGCLGPKADPKCRNGAHLDCDCLRESKIPKMELMFIKTQRDKIGEKGGMQISLGDKKEDARQRARVARKEADSKDVNQNNQKAKDLELEDRKREEEKRSAIEEKSNEMEEVHVEDAGNFDKAEKSKWRNRMDLSGTAEVSMRYELSVRSTAAVA